MPVPKPPDEKINLALPNNRSNGHTIIHTR